ncbi:hypothetical protein [Ralstonia pseudosolanacearum]
MMTLASHALYNRFNRVITQILNSRPSQSSKFIDIAHSILKWQAASHTRIWPCFCISVH